MDFTPKIEDVLLKDLVIIDVDPFKDKQELFSYISAKFEELGIVTDAKAFETSLYEREELGSTCMGNEIALPHGKCPQVQKSAIAFIRCKDSFIYKSNDEAEPTRYVFALAISGAPEDNSHLRILSVLARYLATDEFLELVARIRSYDELIEGIRKINID